MAGKITATRFLAPRDVDERVGGGDPLNYSLVCSTRRQTIPALGSLAFDAQIAFLSGAQEAPLKGIEPAEKNVPELWPSEDLAKNPAVHSQTTTLGFVPRAQEALFLSALGEQMQTWPKGANRQVGYPREAGISVVAVRFAPEGMLVGISDTARWKLRAPWVESHFFGKGVASVDLEEFEGLGGDCAEHDFRQQPTLMTFRIYDLHRARDAALKHASPFVALAAGLAGLSPDESGFRSQKGEAEGALFTFLNGQVEAQEIKEAMQAGQLKAREQAAQIEQAIQMGQSGQIEQVRAHGQKSGSGSNADSKGAWELASLPFFTDVSALGREDVAQTDNEAQGSGKKGGNSQPRRGPRRL